MPAYRFEALQTDGALRKGTVEADSQKTARSQLRAQSLVPLVVEAIATGSASEAASAPPSHARRDASQPEGGLSLAASGAGAGAGTAAITAAASSSEVT